MFKNLFLQANKDRVEQIHSRGLKVIKHSCGNNASLLDYFVEIGYDCYEPGFPISNREELSNSVKKHRQRADLGRLQLTSQEAPNG